MNEDTQYLFVQTFSDLKQGDYMNISFTILLLEVVILITVSPSPYLIWKCIKWGKIATKMSRI